MKTTQLTKIYEKMTNKERAVLALSISGENNTFELEKLESSVTWKNYNCIDFHYRQWRDGLTHMISFWAIEHWRLRTQQIGSLAQHILLSQKQRREEADDALIVLLRWESRLLGLDRALENICIKHRLDIESIRRLAGADPFATTFPGTDADIAYQDNIYTDMSDCLPTDLS